jgi:ribosomal protein S28E/S33
MNQITTRFTAKEVRVGMELLLQDGTFRAVSHKEFQNEGEVALFIGLSGLHFGEVTQVEIRASFLQACELEVGDVICDETWGDVRLVDVHTFPREGRALTELVFRDPHYTLLQARIFRADDLVRLSKAVR